MRFYLALLCLFSLQCVAEIHRSTTDVLGRGAVFPHRAWLSDPHASSLCGIGLHDAIDASVTFGTDGTAMFSVTALLRQAGSTASPESVCRTAASFLPPSVAQVAGRACLTATEAPELAFGFVASLAAEAHTPPLNATAGTGPGGLSTGGVVRNVRAPAPAVVTATAVIPLRAASAGNAVSSPDLLALHAITNAAVSAVSSSPHANTSLEALSRALSRLRFFISCPSSDSGPLSVFLPPIPHDAASRRRLRGVAAPAAFVEAFPTYTGLSSPPPPCQCRGSRVFDPHSGGAFRRDLMLSVTCSQSSASAVPTVTSTTAVASASECAARVAQSKLPGLSKGLCKWGILQPPGPAGYADPYAAAERDRLSGPDSTFWGLASGSGGAQRSWVFGFVDIEAPTDEAAAGAADAQLRVTLTDGAAVVWLADSPPHPTNSTSNLVASGVLELGSRYRAPKPGGGLALNPLPGALPVVVCYPSPAHTPAPTHVPGVGVLTQGPVVVIAGKGDGFTWDDDPSPTVPLIYSVPVGDTDWAGVVRFATATAAISVAVVVGAAALS